METKEIKIGGYTFLVRKNRSFKAQCEIQEKSMKGKPLTPMDIVKADCKVKEGKEFISISDKVLEDLDDVDGLELFHQVMDYRGGSDFQLKEKSKKKPKASSGKSKKSSE